MIPPTDLERITRAMRKVQDAADCLKSAIHVYDGLEWDGRMKEVLAELEEIASGLHRDEMRYRTGAR